LHQRELDKEGRIGGSGKARDSRTGRGLLLKGVALYSFGGAEEKRAACQGKRDGEDPEKKSKRREGVYFVFGTVECCAGRCARCRP